MQTSIASPYMAHQQQMAALLAQRQSMLLTASASSGIKLPGNQPLQDLSSLSNNLSTWSTPGPQPVGAVMNNIGRQFAGMQYSQVRLADVLVALLCKDQYVCWP